MNKENQLREDLIGLIKTFTGIYLDGFYNLSTKLLKGIALALSDDNSEGRKRLLQGILEAIDKAK